MEGGARDPLIGMSVLGGYVISGVLGSGGMGSVYIAEHPRIRKKVAIKVLHTHMIGNREIVERFLAEARAASAIDHPNIIDVVDAATLEDGRDYIALEFVEGQSLERYLASHGPLDVPAALTILAQACCGLEAAHHRKIVHRDLKPANLLIAPTELEPLRVKILDFGIAKLGDPLLAGGAQTQPNAVVGTPGYMPLEQVRGMRNVDHRADLYSLGAVAYEMLTGAMPYDGESLGELIYQQLSAPPTDIRERRGDLDDGWCDAIMSCLSSAPGARPPSARDVALQLAAATPGGTEIVEAAAPRLFTPGVIERNRELVESIGLPPNEVPLAEVPLAEVDWPAVASTEVSAGADALARTEVGDAAAHPGRQLPQTDRLPLPEIPSIAVLPFDSAGAGPEAEAFGDGVTEDIITDLASVAGLFVIGRRSVFAFKNQQVPARQVARALGVRYVLFGSIRTTSGRARITAQLVDAEVGNQIWAERYDRALDDVFAVQSDVSGRVVSALELVLSPREKERLDRGRAVSKEAYELFLIARRMYAPPTLARVNRARELFERVIELAPQFGGGYAGASLMISLKLMFGNSSDAPAEVKIAARYAQRSIEIDPTLAWGQMALGTVRLAQRDHDAGVAALRRAVELEPNNPDAHAHLGLHLNFSGEHAEAVEHLKQAIRIEPEYLGPYLNMLGFAYTAAGRYAEAIDAFRTNDERGGPVDTPALEPWVVAHNELGQVREAAEVRRRLLALLPHSTIGPRTFLRSYKDPQLVGRLEAAYDRAGIP